jgi:hypothetical protein
MIQVDQLENVFRAATHDAFAYQAVSLHQVLFLTDGAVFRTCTYGNLHSSGPDDQEH